MTNLGENSNRLLFWNPAFSLDVAIEVAGVAKLCDDVGIILCLKDIIKLEDVLLTQRFESVDFILQES